MNAGFFDQNGKLVLTESNETFTNSQAMEWIDEHSKR